MSDTEDMDTMNEKEEENITPTKRAAVIKRQNEKKDTDELDEELGGVDDLPEEDDEDYDQEYTTKKKKPEKKKEPILDPAFQSRLVRKEYFDLFAKKKKIKFIYLRNRFYFLYKLIIFNN